METTLLLQNLEADSSMIRAVMEPSTGQVLGAVAGLIMVIAVIALIASIISWIGRTTRSKDYRTLISDMFVAGKVRQIAEEEKVDLEAELKTFKTWQKKDYLKGTDIDTTVSVNLRDKITAVAEKEIDALDKKGKED